MTLREEIEKEIQKAAGLAGERLFLVSPPRPQLGDYATNIAFLVAKKRHQKPDIVAKQLMAKLCSRPKLSRLFGDIKAEGGFINFILAESFIRKRFGRFSESKKFFEKAGKKKAVLVEYSSPNIGKPLSIAHIRSTVIGDALARIYRSLNYRVITDNHLGDWGLQTGILIASYKLFGKKSPEKLSLEELLNLYVRFNEAMVDHLELEAKAKLETKDLQDGRPETLRIWRALRKKSLSEFQKSYRLLSIKFDHILGESAYRKLLPGVVSESLTRKVAKVSEGAVVIPLEGKHLPPVIIQKSDGGYLYHTFDLATIYWRNQKLKPQKVLYVVSNEQALHFEQLFLAAQNLDWTKHCELRHVKFGLMRGEDLKRLSTRKGKIILLEDVIKEAIRRARKIVEKKNPRLRQGFGGQAKLSKKEKDSIAKKVGIGALKYNDLSQNRNTDIIFDWDKMLDFKGNSAPYLQYTYARLRSIARKASKKSYALRTTHYALLKKPEEIALMKKVLQFPEAVEDAAKDNLPNLLCNYLWELAVAANAFYEKYPVLKAELSVRNARLLLIENIARVLKEGLLILGIEAPEQV